MTRTIRRLLPVFLAAASLATFAGPVPAADAAGTAKVRIVDHYHHGKVRVAVDGVQRTVAYGDRTAFFSIIPVKSGNDGVSVTSLRYDGCGAGDAANFFDGGHRYRVVIYAPAGERCQTGGDSTVAGPNFKVIKIS